MTRAAGFTLIEVTLGLVIAGIVALLAYGTVATATEVQERLTLGRSTLQARSAWRSLVADAVRNARSNPGFEGPSLILQDDGSSEGAPSDRLVLVTAASRPPFDVGADWRVSFSVDAQGLVVEAAPLGVPSPARIVRAPSEVTGWDVEALVPGMGWVNSWTGDLPAALRIVFWSEEGPSDVPLVLTVPLESGP